MTSRDEHDVGCVLCEPFFETHNTNTDHCNCSNDFKKIYTKYSNYTPWPTMCEVAVEMQRMVSCEHKAADTFGMSYYDWAEHRLSSAEEYPRMKLHKIGSGGSGRCRGDYFNGRRTDLWHASALL